MNFIPPTPATASVKRGKGYLKALVTGGTGFIGSHLVEALVAKAVHVRCLMREKSDPKWLKGLAIERVAGDCCDVASLREAVKGVDCVFHLAGVTKATREETYFEVNGRGTDNLIHACLESNPRPPRFIYLSSQAAAGPSRNGCRKKESDTCEPVSPYGQSKRMGEELALAHSHELPLVILRPSAVYGPREKDIYSYFKLVSKRMKPYFIGESPRLSLVYVDDVVQALLLASQVDAPKGDIFFVSDGHDYLLQDVGDTFAQVLGVSAVRIPVPEWGLHCAAAFSEVFSRISKRPPLISKGKVEEIIQKDWVCDITQAREFLYFEPHFPLAQGAARTVDWYRKEKWL
jgi:dihydroflavonol-4-reductase